MLELLFLKKNKKNNKFTLCFSFLKIYETVSVKIREMDDIRYPPQDQNEVANVNVAQEYLLSC